MKFRTILVTALSAAALAGCGAHPVPAVTAWAERAVTAPARPAARLDTYLAEGQDLASTSVQRPSCREGCPLNELGTVVLDNMRWHTWDATTATGTGTVSIQSCGEVYCSGMPQYSAEVEVTFSEPVRDCAAGQAYWTRAVLSYPDGLGEAPAPPDPWNFTALAGQARQTCHR